MTFSCPVREIHLFNIIMLLLTAVWISCNFIAVTMTILNICPWVRFQFSDSSLDEKKSFKAKKSNCVKGAGLENHPCPVKKDRSCCSTTASHTPEPLMPSPACSHLTLLLTPKIYMESSSKWWHGWMPLAAYLSSLRGNSAMHGIACSYLPLEQNISMNTEVMVGGSGCVLVNVFFNISYTILPGLKVTAWWPSTLASFTPSNR